MCHTVSQKHLSAELKKTLGQLSNMHAYSSNYFPAEKNINLARNLRVKI